MMKKLTNGRRSLISYKKCKVPHLGHQNRNFNYEMNRGWIYCVEDENDLVIMIKKDLKVSEQCLERRNETIGGN